MPHDDTAPETHDEPRAPLTTDDIRDMLDRYDAMEQVLLDLIDFIEDNGGVFTNSHGDSFTSPMGPSGDLANIYLEACDAVDSDPMELEEGAELRDRTESCRD